MREQDVIVLGLWVHGRVRGLDVLDLVTGSTSLDGNPCAKQGHATVPRASCTPSSTAGQHRSVRTCDIAVRRDQPAEHPGFEGGTSVAHPLQTDRTPPWSSQPEAIAAMVIGLNRRSATTSGGRAISASLGRRS